MEAVLPHAAAATAAADLRNLGCRSLNDGVRSHAEMEQILGLLKFHNMAEVKLGCSVSG